MNKHYALVSLDILSEAVDRLYTYAIPEALNEKIVKGMRVSVKFGKRTNPICAYVLDIFDETDIDVKKIKEIEGIYEDYPVFSEEMLLLADWMKEKYYTTLSICLRQILPPGLKKTPDVKPRQGKKAEPPVYDDIKSLKAALTCEQEAVLDTVLSKLRGSDLQPILLHGVTGSGKTEVYLIAIEEVLKAGKEAIMLVPEIALTTQMVSIFTKRFGDKLAVTHSRLSSKERFVKWNEARLGEVSVMIGPRSAVFAPFKNLGIIIIDEEHEHTYRSESSPKFDTKAVAIKRGEYSKALVILGSATPSLDSYYKSQSLNEYKLLTMSQRVNGLFPEVHVVDMRKELISGNTSIFGLEFMQAVADNIKTGRQTILFLNRRGHSPFVSCRSCGYVMECGNCRVNLTYHAANGRLMCHYCGHSSAIPKTCPACASPYIKYFGIGTQKIEEEVARLFPEAKALRIDMDTTRQKNGHAKILSAFRREEAQILIGTQMIAKGLDFPKVTLVGVMAADIALFSGDFKAAEHTFQLLTQVSGRAGRAEDLGRVYIQTYNPDHYSITLAKNADYINFYRQEIVIREAMSYPPFSHVFMVMFSGPREKEIITALNKLLAIMEYCNKKGRFEMIGPASAFVSKIKNLYRWRILVKNEDEDLLKKFVLYCVGKLKENDPLKDISIFLTMDPVNME